MMVQKGRILNGTKISYGHLGGFQLPKSDIFESREDIGNNKD